MGSSPIQKCLLLGGKFVSDVHQFLVDIRNHRTTEHRVNRIHLHITTRILHLCTHHHVRTVGKLQARINPIPLLLLLILIRIVL